MCLSSILLHYYINTNKVTSLSSLNIVIDKGEVLFLYIHHMTGSGGTTCKYEITL